MSDRNLNKIYENYQKQRGRMWYKYFQEKRDGQKHGGISHVTHRHHASRVKKVG